MSNALHDIATGTLFGVALNYQGLLLKRLSEFEQPPYQKLPVKPLLFIKTPNTCNVFGGSVVHPGAGTSLQPGPALGVVIGKDASRVSVDEALNHVAGYSIVNEFSLPEESYYRPAVKAKCRDGFCTIGPEFIPREQLANPHDLTLQLLVNGELRQEDSTANLVRNIPQFIAKISDFMTLYAGDLLITGTPLGRVDVLPGDCVRVEIQGLGCLTNVIVAEQEGAV